MASQPVWKCVANLGDADHIDYGGYFVYVDKTGVYPPEAELLEVNEPEVTGYRDRDESAEPTWTVRRFILDQCTFVSGILSDNSFHPESSAWFAPSDAEIKARPQDSTLQDVCEESDITLDDMRANLCSADPIKRAFAYRAIGDCFGWDNFDEYPNEFTDRAEVEARYAADLEALENQPKTPRGWESV